MKILILMPTLNTLLFRKNYPVLIGFFDKSISFELRISSTGSFVILRQRRHPMRKFPGDEVGFLGNDFSSLLTIKIRFQVIGSRMYEFSFLRCIVFIEVVVISVICSVVCHSYDTRHM